MSSQERTTTGKSGKRLTSGRKRGFNLTMNRCRTYLIKCPKALKMWEELPCIGTQGFCDNWRERYEKEQREEYAAAMKVKESYPEHSFEDKVRKLEEEIEKTG